MGLRAFGARVTASCERKTGNHGHALLRHPAHDVRDLFCLASTKLVRRKQYDKQATTFTSTIESFYLIRSKLDIGVPKHPHVLVAQIGSKLLCGFPCMRG